MTAPHFVVFIGASASLSTELAALKGRFEATTIIAPAVGRHDRGLTQAAIYRATEALVRTLKAQPAHHEPARLSVWGYEPTEDNQFQLFWDMFGKSAWIELVPSRLRDKDRPTRSHMQSRMSALVQLLHVVAHNVFNARRNSPLSLPHKNFRNPLLNDFREYWYRGASVTSLRQIIENQTQRFRQLRTGSGVHKDDRALFFSAARDGECHGQPHTMGDFDRCYVEGRFRFGAALYPGFHYDVRKETGLLDCVLYD
jgi:hypothetical protein